MKKEITAFITDLNSGDKLGSLDKASIKQAIVLRLLSFLGWDIFDVEEVYPDFSINSHLVSYALRVDGKIRMLIEFRGRREKLEEHQKQFVACAVKGGVDLCVLTNGTQWWFFLAADRGGRIHKRYHHCDIRKTAVDKMVAGFIDFMSRAKVAKGEAFKSAKSRYRSQRQKIATDALPEAWNQILSPPNKILVEILSEITEKLCGYRADSHLVEQFIKTNFSRWQLKVTESTKAGEDFPTNDSPGSEPSGGIEESRSFPQRLKSYNGHRICAYGFNGHRQNVNNWEEMLLSLCEFFAAAHPQDFEKVLWISDHQRPYFSTNSEELRIPEKIKKTSIYVETKLGPDEIVKIADDLLAEFGYDSAQLDITLN